MIKNFRVDSGPARADREGRTFVWSGLFGPIAVPSGRLGGRARETPRTTDGGLLFFGQNYNIGLEPTTAHPAGSISEAQKANGTMKTLDPGETVSASIVATTYGGFEAVNNVSETGTRGGRDHE